MSIGFDDETKFLCTTRGRIVYNAETNRRMWFCGLERPNEAAIGIKKKRI